MFCGSCGAQLAEGQNFCPNCGAALSAEATTPQPEVAPVQQSQPLDQQVTQQPIDQPAVQSSEQQVYAQPAEQQPYAQPAAQQSYDQSYAQPAAQQPYAQDPYGQPAAQQPYAQPAAQQPYAQDPYAQPGAQQPYGQQYQQPGQPAYPVTYMPAAAEVHPEYQQLGGWLLFFVILMILSVVGTLGSLGSIGVIASELPSSYGGYIVATTVVSLVQAGLNIGFLVLIFKRNDIFLKYYQIISIVDIALAVLLSIYASTSVMGGFSFAGTLPSIAGGVIGLVLMTMYFCKSVRVRTYMGSTAYMDKALFKIGV